MKIDGACHCGQITYEAEINPDRIGICHCTDCQTLTGSAYRTVAVSLKGTFKLLSGSPKHYVKTAASGSKRTHGFCPNCGTPISSSPSEDTTGVVGLRVGSIRQRAELKPTRQIWCDSALPWVDDLSAIPKKAQQ